MVYLWEEFWGSEAISEGARRKEPSEIAKSTNDGSMLLTGRRKSFIDQLFHLPVLTDPSSVFHSQLSHGFRSSTHWEVFHLCGKELDGQLIPFLRGRNTTAAASTNTHIRAARRTIGATKPQSATADKQTTSTQTLIQHGTGRNSLWMEVHSLLVGSLRQYLT